MSALDILDKVSGLVYQMIFGKTETTEKEIEEPKEIEKIPKDLSDEDNPIIEEQMTEFSVGEYASRAIVRHKAVEIYPNEKNSKHLKAREQYVEQNWEEVFPTVQKQLTDFENRQKPLNITCD